MGSDTHHSPYLTRPAQVDHTCGHRFTHLVPVMPTDAAELLGVLETFALHPCPACMAGVPDWIAGAYPQRGDGSEAGAC